MGTETAVESGGTTRLTDGRGFRVALGLTTVGLLGLLWPALCTAPGLHWNPARLAPSFALAYGKSIYALRNSAEQLGWIYGPVFPVWYLPVTLTKNPTGALVLATLGNGLTLLVPFGLVLRRAGVTRVASLVFAVVVLVALLMAHRVLRWEFYFIHVDTVCVALGLISCVALHRTAERDEGWPLHVAAIAVALALWTKQLAVMLAPGLLLWLWTEGHRRLISPFLFRCVCYTGALSAGIFLWFGTEPVLFNLVLYHLRSPAQGGPGLIVRWLVDIATGLWTWLPLIAIALWTVMTIRDDREVGEKRAGRKEEEMGLKRGGGGSSLIAPQARSLIRLLLWAALAQLPLGLLALQRPDGGVNSLHSLHYLLVAGIVWVVVRVDPPSPSGLWRGRPGMNGRQGLAWGAALLMTVAFGFVHTRRERPEWRLYRGQEELLAKVQASPNTYYLPWNPLITLMGERKIYPFDDALQCLWLRQLEVPPAIVRAALPPKPILLYYEPVQSKFALRYFPEMKR